MSFNKKTYNILTTKTVLELEVKKEKVVINKNTIITIYWEALLDIFSSTKMAAVNTYIYAK